MRHAKRFLLCKVLRRHDPYGARLLGGQVLWRPLGFTACQRCGILLGQPRSHV